MVNEDRRSMDLPGPDPIYTTLTDVTEFATDSLLEGDGFELPVPLSQKGLLGLPEGMAER